MRYLEPDVIVIDDVINEIQGIVNYYQSTGIGCKFYNASYHEGDQMPSKPYTNVNLIFLDLYYSEKFDVEQCSNWIQSLVPERTFYLLVLWTRDTAKASEVLDNLRKANRTPFTHLVKSKTEYVTNSPDKFDFTKLFSELDEALEEVPALSEVLIWKRNVMISSNEVLGYLAKISQPDKFNNKLKKIIVSHGGTSVKVKEEYNRKRSILFDALDSILISNTKKNLQEEEIATINKEDLYNLESIEEPVVDKELNSWFHFRLEKNLSSDFITPGLIALNESSLFRKIYSIQDDPKIEKFLKKQIEGGVALEDIALVISRPCDIAQNKFGKNIKLLSGLILKKAIRNRKEEIDFNGIKLPDSVKKYEHLYFDEVDDDVTLLFDFRYSFSVPEKIFRDKFKIIKIFNKELLSEMQVEYSSYSSRLGITQII